MVESEKPKIKMYGYFRSGASWRMRLYFNFRGMEYENEFVNLLKGDQKGDAYAEVNPNKMVPTVDIEDNGKMVRLAESMAICEYLEEVYPGDNGLLPKDPLEKHKVRRVCEMVNAGMQPIANLSILKHVAETFGDEHKLPWAKWAQEARFEGLEAMVKEYRGQFCCGDKVTLADCFMIPQYCTGLRFGADMEKYPNLTVVYNNLKDMPEVISAHFSNQPDCPESEKPK